MKRFAPILAALFAAPAFSADPILVGQTADFSSLASAQMKEFNAGAMAYISKINQRGGINGRPITLLSRDDGLVAANASKNARDLVEKDHVVALFGSRGTDPTEAVMAIAAETKTPLVAPISGADTVRLNPYVFPVRAGYRDEVDLMLKQMSLAPTTKLALIVQDDKFGNPLAAYIEQTIKKKYPMISHVKSVRFPRKKADLTDEAQSIVASEADAVIALCNPTSCESFIKQTRGIAAVRNRPQPLIYQTSISDMYSQYKKLGASLIAGIPYTQVIPDPTRGVSQTVREYRAAMADSHTPINYRSYEGYVSAIVLCEALRRSDTQTKSDIIRTFARSMDSVNLGEFSAKYSATKKGADFVDLVTVNKDGRLVH